MKLLFGGVLMTWYQLYKRIGKQTIKKTQETRVVVIDNNGVKHECELKYNNGSEIHLVMIN